MSSSIKIRNFVESNFQSFEIHFHSQLDFLSNFVIKFSCIPFKSAKELLGWLKTKEIKRNNFIFSDSKFPTEETISYPLAFPFLER